MSRIISCGVVILNPRRELFVCHATGTSRWDLPKGIQDPDESALRTAVRETWEETSLAVQPESLIDVGLHDYLPSKQLRLFGMSVALDAFDIRECCCHSTFPHRITGLPTFEVDGYAWKSLDHLSDWCGKNLSRVLESLDWSEVRLSPRVASLTVSPDLPAYLP